MRVNKFRKRLYFLFQNGRGAHGIAESEVAIAEAKADPFRVRFLKHLAQRRYGFRKAVLQKQAHAEETQGLAVAWILPQRGSRDFLRRARCFKKRTRKGSAFA